MIHNPAVKVCQYILNSREMPSAIIFNRSSQLISARTIQDNRTIEESKVDNCSLQSVWKNQLQDWPEEIQNKITQALKQSTKRSYDVFVNKFSNFCDKKEKDWKDATTKDIAEFLVEIAHDKQRPKSSLDQALASIAAMFELSDKPSPTHATVITRL